MKYFVRYGAMRLLGVFSHADLPLQHGSRVIIKTPRGQEVGVVRCEATPERIAKLNSGFIEDRILRSMTEADETECRRLQQTEQETLEQCKQIIQEHSAAMELIHVERLFGSERIILYYTAEGRVDFRDLVKVLATELHVRVEMRQINVREKMKLLDNIGDCGRDLCCGCYLHEAPAVSMKMAKLQRVTLDPIKISGHCGRLKCCLRYEYDCYAEANKDGKRQTADGSREEQRAENEGTP
jgi:cell fate regulator YaaT (PSP1 superfamily)